MVIALIIAAIFVGIIFVLLISSLKITFRLSDSVIFYITFLGFRIFDINSKPKTKKSEDKEKGKLTGVLKEYAKGKSRKKLVGEILVILKALCEKFIKLIKHIRFNKLEFSLTVASDDAAKTALAYGTACSVVYSICGMLSSAYKFNPKKVNVSADFSTEQITLKVNTVIKIRLIHLVKFALSTAFSIIKLKLGEVKNGRT